MNTSSGLKLYIFKSTSRKMAVIFFSSAFIVIYCIGLIAATNIIADIKGMSHFASSKWTRIVGMPFIYCVIIVFLVFTLILAAYFIYLNLSGQNYVHNRNRIYAVDIVANKMYLLIYPNLTAAKSVVNYNSLDVYDLETIKDDVSALFYSVNYNLPPESVEEFLGIEILKSTLRSVEFIGKVKIKCSDGSEKIEKKSYKITDYYEGFEEIKSFICNFKVIEE